MAFLLRLFRSICLRTFVQDVFGVLRPFIRAGTWSDVEAGRLGLSIDVLRDVLDLQRCRVQIAANGRQKVHNFHALFQWLWGERDGFDRGAWSRLPYRMLYATCHQLIVDVLGPEHFRAWRRLLSKHLRFQCWLLPYPHTKMLIGRRRAADGQIHFQWWSNYNYKLAQHLGTDLARHVNCSDWHQWPKGRWSVTPERGLSSIAPSVASC